MDELIVSVSPHLRAKDRTVTIMRDVLVALFPTLVASVLIFGARSLLVTAVCVAAGVLGEWGFEKVTKRPVTVKDLSACVTGVLLAYSLPVSIALWQAALGGLIATVIVKQLFGGLGQNFANPAVTARIILFLSFSGAMTTWTYPDAVSSATPLAILSGLSDSSLPTVSQLLLGSHAGCIGETSAAALALGGVYLLLRRVITWHTPVAFLGTVFLLSLALGRQPVYQLLSGGLMLGAFFMATDYATTPSTALGRIIFGVGCGLVTIVIRIWGSYPEGVSFAILLMNILTPQIHKLTRTKPLGGIQI